MFVCVRTFSTILCSPLNSSFSNIHQTSIRIYKSCIIIEQQLKLSRQFWISTERKFKNSWHLAERFFAFPRVVMTLAMLPMIGNTQYTRIRVKCLPVLPSPVRLSFSSTSVSIQFLLPSFSIGVSPPPSPPSSSSWTLRFLGSGSRFWSTAASQSLEVPAK